MSVHRYRIQGMFALAAACAIAACAGPAQRSGPPAMSKPLAERTYIDYFLPTPVIGKLSQEAWGAANVLPRDPQNGLEDPTITKYCYWDGQIIKAADGKYHMFAERSGGQGAQCDGINDA